MSITFTDFFCGFGGSSQGLTEAGLELRWAANHWDRAIETHAANFRDADHFQGDISGYDMRRVPSADLAWMSPECTWHSPAGGRKRLRAELDLFDDYVPDAAGERSRATMWDVVRAAEAKQFRILIVENVVEVTTWPLFQNWLDGMSTLGYEHQIVCVTAAHIGGDRNPHAPQWRDRIYFVFYKRGVPMPVIEPRPLAWCSQCEAVVESRQSWKRTDRRYRVGKYGPQYVYVCAAGQHPSHIVEPFVLPAAAAIDWSDLGTRIADREKPLAAATMRRIEAGIRMFARPMVVAHSGQTWDAAKSGEGDYMRVQPADESPLMTRQAGGTGDGVAVPPFVTNVRHGADDHGRQFLPGEQPMPTAQTKIGEGIVSPPFIDVARTNNHPHGTDEPLSPMTTGRNRGMVVPSGGTWNETAYPTDEPLRTRLTRDAEGLVSPPFIAVAAHGDSGGRRVFPITDPLNARLTSTADGVVLPPFVAELRGTSTARGVEDDALGAVTAGGNHHGLTVPDGAFLSRQYNARGSDDSHLNTSVGEPTHPITASGGNHALVIPYRRGRAARATADPLPTQTTSNTTGLLVPDFTPEEMAEIVQGSRFRMLGPREHLRAQRFPDWYVVKGNKSEQTKGAGNAVASNVAHWLGTFVLIALAGVEKGRAA